MLKKGILLLILILPMPILNPAAEGFQTDRTGEGWRAGVATVDITPEASMWMAGYAARNRPSEGVLHPIYAKALALEDNRGNHSVLVTADLIRFPKALSDRVRSRITEDFGLNRADIILNSSHTHTGPELESERYKYQLESDQLEHIDNYARRLENQLVDLVGEVLQSLEPAVLYTGDGVARFAVNRRNNTENTLYMQTELAGPVDHAVPVIKVENRQGEVKAIAFGYACHPTVLSDYQISGDYPGFAQMELENRFPEATALFFQGAGGDQNPLPRRTVELAQQYGGELANAVTRVLKEEMVPLETGLSTAYSELDLKFANPTPDEDELLAILEDSSGYPEWQKNQARLLLDQLQRGDTLMTSYPYPVQLWKLGDQHLVALGGELLVDYAIALKRIFGPELFVLGYSNDVMGYLPSARVIREGGYEGERSPVFTTPWDPDIETRIIHEVVRLANALDSP